MLTVVSRIYDDSNEQYWLTVTVASSTNGYGSEQYGIYDDSNEQYLRWR